MTLLQERPTRITVTKDGRRLYPCGCVDVPDSRLTYMPLFRPFLFCASWQCWSRGRNRTLPTFDAEAGR